MNDTATIDTAPKDERNWAMFCHLSGFFGYAFPFLGNILGPLVMWLLKREEWPLVDNQGKEALNFQISWTIYGFAACLFSVILIGIPFLLALFVSHVILMIVATIKASEGQHFRYPMTMRIIE